MKLPLGLLIVEDNRTDYELTAEHLKNEVENLTWARTLAEAIAALNTTNFDVLLLDLDVPDSRGLGSLDKLRDSCERLPAIIVLTGNNDEDVAKEALIRGAQDYLIKDQANTQWLMRSIRYAIERHKVDAQLRAAYEELVGLNTQLVSLTMELIEARDSALDASRVKSEFLANISHEIRTPLSGIVSIAELLELEQCSEEVTELHATLHESATRLVGTVSDLLDLSKLEVGKMVVNNNNCDVRALVDEVVMTVRPTAKLKQVLIDAQVSEGVPQTVVIDEAKLRQILMNLLHNAVKFTHKGSVHIEMLCETRNSEVLRIEVKDTGIGISENSKKHIFEAFMQADASTTRRYGGSGLGLAICKKSAELLGGEIGVDSVEGKGTTFWLIVPLVAAS